MTEGRDREEPSVTTSPPESESVLSLDTVFEVLANRRRRFALYTLLDARNGVVPFDALVEDVATLLAAVDGDAVRCDRYLELGTDLYHWHLPVLADVGLIDYDPRQKTIRYWPDPLLEHWLKRVKQDELP